MAPSYFVLDPMDCILERTSAPHSLQKRAPPSGGEGTVPPTDSDSSDKVIVIIAATVGSLLLIFSLGLFYCCMRRRRANHRIGQLQQFLPTFMDKEKTEKYFQNQNSSSTLVVPASPKSPSQPANAHHRTRSVPVAFAKGVKDHRNRQLERDGSLGQFQQISLGSDDNVNEKEELTPKRSILGARARATTVSAPAPVVSSLHRSVSLNKNNISNSINNRTGTMEEEEPETSSKFADGENLVAPNRFSALLDFSQDNKIINRFSAMSVSGVDPNFDPTRFSTASVMFDAKRISNLSTATADDTISISSSDDFNNSLPPHQKHHSFHSHHNSPTIRSREVSTDVPVTVVSNHPSYFGDKQELEEDDEVVSQHVNSHHMSGGYAAPMGPQGYQKQEFYPPLQQNSLMPTQMAMPMVMPIPTHAAVATAHGVPVPPRIMFSRSNGGQEMSLSTGDREMEHQHSS
ncbi:hypothetical protein BG011_007922 [Mortierella polycephala]|uniref:Uncharacterized protein n=1 Tax=Mortierella polycephala TaxID=41804 RepID=A0A9P6U877_9FUNG|nr:hypothetical protein BG011_007922 [Mortierella polycephala]